MSTLQGTINYAGNADTAPVDEVELQFRLPGYEYYSEGGETAMKGEAARQLKVDRRLVETRSESLGTTVRAKTYRLKIPDEIIIGADKSLFLRYLASVLTSGNADSLSVTVQVDYLAERQFEIGTQAVELVFFPKLGRDASKPQMLDVERDISSIALFAINRTAFVKLLRKLNEEAPTFAPMLLLKIISMLVDTQGDKPVLSKKFAAAAPQELLAQIEDAGIEGGQAVLDNIQRASDSLFEIPLQIPEIRAITLGGTFTVLTPDQAPISRQDLLRYDLSASYSDRGTGVLRTLHYRFSGNPVIQDNSTDFAFDDSALFRENIDGPITVKVLGGSTGAPLWTLDFKPTDPDLDKIEIEVPLVGGGGLMSVGDPHVRDAAKKLRGQVLDLSKKCQLKDLTVLIQAKREGDNAWRVVAAATADKFGNFSMPYPYGVFMKAQAMVSLMPNNPAEIPIVAAANPKQTIADDFLYLLLSNVDCEQGKDDDDCGCNSKKDASRLPDFADLIGSSEYSQDIGGSCVNLSTPNRTLSEFNYRAIVRTSDPQVANYTLRKVEPLVSDVAPVLDALSASNTTTNAVLGVLIGLNADLNASLSPLDAALNSASNSTLTALGAVLNRLNIALGPLHTAPVPSLSASLGALNAALSASDGFKTSLNNALGPLKAAITAANDAANAALQAALTVAKPDTKDLFSFLTGTQNAGSNALFNPLNSFMASAADAANATQAAAYKNALNGALANANQTLNIALATSQPALNAVMNALSAVNSTDASARYELVGGAKKFSRRTIDLDNPIAWQDAPEDPSVSQSTVFSKRMLGPLSRMGGSKNTSVTPESGKNLSFYQAVTVATGHILHYKSLFKADGYSLGDLIYSLPLAPGQKKEIVVFDASHTLQGAESQLLSQGERLNASIANERGLLTQLSGAITETMRGSSSANTSGVSAGFGTGGQGYGGMGGQGSTGGYGGSGSAVIGVAGGIANSNANAEQDSSRVISQFFADKLRQSIMQNAESYRQLNASVVTTVQERQRYGVTSEVVANHNHCHALTMMYFEVLRHYAVYQKLSSVEECVFVPLLMTNFTTQNVYKWRDVLARFLLPMPSETYLPSPPVNAAGGAQQHPLLRGFDANERIKSKYANVDFPEGAYDDEQIQFVRGTMRLRVELPRPRTRFDRIKSFPLTKQIDAQALGYDSLKYSQDMVAYSTKSAVTAGLWTLFNTPPNPPNPQQYEVIAREAIFDTFMSLDASYQTVPPGECIRIKNFKPPATISVGVGFPALTVSVTTPESFFAENIDDQKQWQAYAEVLGYTNVLDLLNAYFAGNLISEWDSIFYNEIVPLVFEKIVSSIGLSEIATDFSSEGRYKGGERLMRLNVTGNSSRKRNQMPLRLSLTVNNSRLAKLKEFVTLDIIDLTITYSTAHYNGVLFSGNVSDDLLDGAELFIPESAEEKRNPRKEDAYLVCKLIEHLNSNLEYYNKVLWYNLDPDRRYMLLDGFGILTYNDSGLPVDKDGQPIPLLRSLASVVKNELVTITGNSLVFPVAAGFRVSQDYIVERVPDDDEEDGDGKKTKVVKLLDHYQPITPIEPFRISVPTKGVFCEAVQGACNACEKIETDRLQDWNRFPNTDEPTPIAPVNTPVPAVTDWKAAFKDFATPVVNIQNAPTAPEPGAGLAALTELLGKSGVFKDITGLDATQQNVIRAFLSNQENAKAFGEIAKEMAMQSHNTQNSGRIMDSIAQAKDSGDISKEDAGRLVKDHLQQQIDGGQTKRNDLAKQRQLTPITQAALEAGNQGLPFKAQVSDSEVGLSESVEVGNFSEGTGGSGGGTLKSKIDRTLASLLEGSTVDRALKLFEGPDADEKVASLLMKAQTKKLTDGTEIVPGTIIGGRTMLVDADDAYAYFVKDGVLWEWRTQRFLRSEYISAQMEAVVGVEPLVKLAYIEIALLAGLFAGPELVAGQGATLIGTLQGGALVLASHVVDKGLKLYHYRTEVNTAYRAFRRVLAARDCLHKAVPEMMDRLERKVEWETLKSIPSQFTAKEVAFWLGRCFRGVILIDGKIVFLAVAKSIGLTTLFLGALDTALGTPAAFAAALETQADKFVTEFSDDEVAVTNAEAQQWLTILRNNAQARQCLQNLKAALEELTAPLETLLPLLEV